MNLRLMNSAAQLHRYSPLLLWGLVLLLTGWLYWPGTHGPAMLDDHASVSVLDELNENPQLAMDYIFGDAAGPLGRPVSMATFVVEKLYLNQGIRGGKKLNIILHLFIGCLVVWLFFLLFRQAQTFFFEPGWLAVLAGAVWLLSPLYVSTVLYVVQRMAMLAALFIVAACISYIYCRGAFVRSKKGLSSLLLLLTFILLVLAVFAKETGIVGLPIVLLIEALWFQFRDPAGQVIRWLRCVVLLSILGGIIFLVSFFTLGKNWIIGTYALREFTLTERVLTQSRILWDYLGQLLLPDVLRMGLYHDDILVSTSMSQPATTSYAVYAWVCVLIVSMVLLKWRNGRYLVFAAAVFLIGHSTESTILPLELYYEHRNYLPGIGVFLGISVLLIFLFERFPEVITPVLAWGWVFVLVLAMKTSSQVQIWSSAPLLYMNDVNAHPQSFRANANMASQLAAVGALEGALNYSSKAHLSSHMERQGDYDLRDLSLSCISDQALPPERISNLGRVDPSRPLSSVSTLNVLVRQIQNNDCPNFDRMSFSNRMEEIFLSDECCSDELDGNKFREKASPNIYAGLAVLENALERYDNAYEYTERFLAGSPGNIRGLLMKLHFATALHKGEEVSSLLIQLQSLETSGVLSLADKQTLSLYKEKND